MNPNIRGNNFGISPEQLNLAALEAMYPVLRTNTVEYISSSTADVVEISNAAFRYIVLTGLTRQIKLPGSAKLQFGATYVIANRSDNDIVTIKYNINSVTGDGSTINLTKDSLLRFKWTGDSWDIEELAKYSFFNNFNDSDGEIPIYCVTNRIITCDNLSPNPRKSIVLYPTSATKPGSSIIVYNFGTNDVPVNYYKTNGDMHTYTITANITGKFIWTGLDWHVDEPTEYTHTTLNSQNDELIVKVVNDRNIVVRPTDVGTSINIQNDDAIHLGTLLTVYNIGEEYVDVVFNKDTLTEYHKIVYPGEYKSIMWVGDAWDSYDYFNTVIFTNLNEPITYTTHTSEKIVFNGTIGANASFSLISAPASRPGAAIELINTTNTAFDKVYIEGRTVNSTNIPYSIPANGQLIFTYTGSGFELPDNLNSYIINNANAVNLYIHTSEKYIFNTAPSSLVIHANDNYTRKGAIIELVNNTNSVLSITGDVIANANYKISTNSKINLVYIGNSICRLYDNDISYIINSNTAQDLYISNTTKYIFNVASTNRIHLIGDDSYTRIGAIIELINNSNGDITDIEFGSDTIHNTIPAGGRLTGIYVGNNSFILSKDSPIVTRSNFNANETFNLYNSGKVIFLKSGEYSQSSAVFTVASSSPAGTTLDLINAMNDRDVSFNYNGTTYKLMANTSVELIHLGNNQFNLIDLSSNVNILSSSTSTEVYLSSNKTISVEGTRTIQFRGYDNLKPGTEVSVFAKSGNITISGLNTVYDNANLVMTTTLNQNMRFKFNGTNWDRITTKYVENASTSITFSNIDPDTIYKLTASGVSSITIQEMNTTNKEVIIEGKFSTGTNTVTFNGGAANTKIIGAAYYPASKNFIISMFDGYAIIGVER